MKAKILFSTLALSAAFVACNNEEILVNENVSTDEIVGAKLLGKGLTMGFGAEGTESRATANGWENGDVAGIAWVTSGNAETSQAGVELKNVGTTVWSNHFYQYNKGEWSTRSNVYEGWHFAYRPYQHQKKAGQLVIDVNGKPMVKADHEADVFDNAPYISAAEFLGEDLVDYANGSIDVTYDISRFVNVIKPKLQISEEFTGHPHLNTIAIKSITVADKRDGMNWFVNSVKINPAKLPQIQYKKYTEGPKNGQYILVDGKKQYDKNATLKLLNYANLYTSGAIQNGAVSNSVTTTIEGDSYLLNGEKTLRMFLAPVRGTSTIDNLYFNVEVEGGHFTIAYTPEKYVGGQKVEYTAIEKKNNEAIEKMVALMAGTFKTDKGKTRSLQTITAEDGSVQPAQTIEMGLGVENFTADYIIEDIDDWNASVKLANALAKENEKPTFRLKDNAEVEFPAGEMNAPVMGVNVTRLNPSYAENAYLIFKNNTTWNHSIVNPGNGTTILVEKTGKLSVAGSLWASSIINKGTILAGPLSTISSADSPRLNNEDGRIEVEYGAYVYPRVDKMGIIAYNVDGTESAAKINTLIASTGNIKGYAQVNTLIIANNASLDLTKKDGDDVNDDRYNGNVQDGNELADMTNVAIEMNGGTIKAALNKVKNVHNVTVKGGVNTIKDVDVMGLLNVEAGSVTVDATEYPVEKTVDGEKVIVNVKNAADVNGIEVKNGATLNVTVDTYTTDIVNAGTIAVTYPYVLRYANTIAQSGSQSGSIVKGSIDLGAAIAAGGEILLTSNLVETLNLTSGQAATINLNDKTITGSIKTNDNLTVKNGEIVNANGNVSAIEINSGKLTLEEVEVASAGHGVKINGEVVAEIKGGEYKATGTASQTGHALYVKKGKVIIYGGIFVGPKDNPAADSGSALCVSAGSEAVIEGGDFSGGAPKTLQVAGKLTVKGGTFDQDPTVYLDPAYKVTEAGGIYTVTKK